MDKILVEIQSPATNKRYEFMLPSNMKVKDAASLAAQTLRRHEKSLAFDQGDLMLCSITANKILDNYITIKEAGIKDGDILLIL